jgi:hypothetical protein
MRLRVSCLRWVQAGETLMQVELNLTEDMQTAVDDVFARLPMHYRTELIRAEIACAVSRSNGVGRSAYEAAARSAVVEMFSTLDRVIENRRKLAPFAK